MANLFDYLVWRGDLNFSQAPLNAVDSLIFCRMSYLPLEGLVPSPGRGEPVLLGEVAEQFRKKGYETTRTLLMPKDGELLQELGKSERFASCKLCGYVDKTCEETEEQFSAVSVLLPTNKLYFAFRGTDNTLVGWKEDFNMSFLSTVPSQQEAVEYLCQMAEFFEGEIFTGGHSKGGNLAVYASAFCGNPVQSRIRKVYNHDGPGFSAEVIHSAGYQAVKERCFTYVPQSSVVGMLLEHEEEYTVVHSTQVGIFQHDAYSWEVLGNGFVTEKHITESSALLDRSLKEWVASMSTAQRKQMVDTLFSLLGAVDVKKMSEAPSMILKNAGKLIMAVRDMDDNTKAMLSRTIRELLAVVRKNFAAYVPIRKRIQESGSVLSEIETETSVEPEIEREKK